MKKEIKKYQVTRKMTEGDIRERGASIYSYRILNKYKWYWIIGALIYSVPAIIVEYIMKDLSKLYAWALILIFGMVSCIFLFKCYKYGKELFAKVKDKPEPIDLDEASK